MEQKGALPDFSFFFFFFLSHFLTEIFMHPPPLFILLARPVEIERQKTAQTVWLRFLPFSPFLLHLLDGLAHIRPPLPSAVASWLRCSFTAMSFPWWMFFFSSLSLSLFFVFLYNLHAQTITAFKRPITRRKTVWKMLNLSSRFRLTKRKCLFGFLGLLRSCVFSGAHDRNARWMQRGKGLPPPPLSSLFFNTI